MTDSKPTSRMAPGGAPSGARNVSGPVPGPVRPGGLRSTAGWVVEPPFLRAPEASRTIFLVIFAAALAPLSAGVFFFGWRALLVAGLSIGGCMLFETGYYRLTQTPALMGRTHAAVMGLLLALSLPAFSPWYVPLVGAFFTIIVGKALFGGVGHFLWHPALVGRLAVTVLFSSPIWSGGPLDPANWPVLAQNRVVLGDILNARPPAGYHQWRGTPAPPDADALALPKPTRTLGELTRPPEAVPPTILTVLRRMPPASDLICGAVGGGIGETCAVAIIIAGIYLVYRNYVQIQLPALFLAGAALTAAVAPVLAGQTPATVRWQWLPFLHEGADVGFTYVAYHVFTGELLLAAWFFAPEMTSRPVTAPAQAIFGLLGGVAAMLLRLYTVFPMPAYGAVLLMNTATPLLDRIRPRVFGRAPWWRRLLRRRSAAPTDRQD